MEDRIDSSLDAPNTRGEGGEQQACYPNGTCNADLTCKDNYCVKVFDSSDADGDAGKSSDTSIDGLVGTKDATGGNESDVIADEGHDADRAPDPADVYPDASDDIVSDGGADSVDADADVAVVRPDVVAQTKPIVEYPVVYPPAPSLIRMCADGNLRVLDSYMRSIERVTPTGSLINEIWLRCNPPTTPCEGILAFAGAADGTIWFVGTMGLGRGVPADGGYRVDKFSAWMPGTGYALRDVTLGPDGNLWVTDGGFGSILRIIPGDEPLSFTEFRAPIDPRGDPTKPGRIISGRDGNLWFIDGIRSSLFRITTSGVITEFPFESWLADGGAGPGIIGLAAGSDGNIWFGEGAGIGRMSPSGAVTEFLLPADSWSRDIVAGADGNIWFADEGTERLGRITPSGLVTAFSLPPIADRDAGRRGPLAIGASPDGRVWYAASWPDALGYLVP